MGNGGETGRAQINLAAKRLDRYQKLLEAGKTIPSGWKRLAAITTADGITVIPATNAIAGHFAYTQFAGEVGRSFEPSSAYPGRCLCLLRSLETVRLLKMANAEAIHPPAEVAKVRESYMQAVSDLRTSVEEITSKYAEVSKNDEITKALKELSTSSRIKQKLLPIKEFTNAVKWLGRFEGSVQTETVELHREGGVDHIDVMLNGKGPVRMVFDTGAGPTTLSAELASRMNLRSTGQTMECVVADGSKVTAKVMVIRTVTIGRLTVKDVTCAVMPKGKGDVAPLLGQSFLQRFDYKYTQGSGRLILNKVEPNEPTTPKKPNSPKRNR